MVCFWRNRERNLRNNENGAHASGNPAILNTLTFHKINNKFYTHKNSAQYCSVSRKRFLFHKCTQKIIKKNIHRIARKEKITSSLVALPIILQILSLNQINAYQSVLKMTK